MFRRPHPKKVNREAPPDVILVVTKSWNHTPEAQHTPWVTQIWNIKAEPDPSPTRVDLPPGFRGQGGSQGPQDHSKVGRRWARGSRPSRSPLVYTTRSAATGLEHRGGLAARCGGCTHSPGDSGDEAGECLSGSQRQPGHNGDPVSDKRNGAGA